MKKKFFLAAVFIFFAALTIPAQEKISDFLGNWKIDAEKNKWFDKSRIESITLNVYQTNDDLIIESTTKMLAVKDNAVKRKEIYKAAGGTKVSLVGGFNGGTQTNQLKFLKNDNLEFFSELTGENLITSIKETWSLSDEGQTLTIKRADRVMQKNLGDNLPPYTMTKWILKKV